MPKPTPPSARVMLLLPAPLAHFVDQLASKLSTPGLVVNRQIAIRHTLSKLMKEMAEASPSASKKAPRSRARP